MAEWIDDPPHEPTMRRFDRIDLFGAEPHRTGLYRRWILDTQ